MGRNGKTIIGHCNLIGFKCVCVPSGDSLKKLYWAKIEILSITNDGCCDWFPNQKRLPPFSNASWLVSISSRCLLKPAYADNKIRAWGDSLATWPKKRWLFVCAAHRPDQGKGSGAGSGREVKGQRMPFSHRTGVPITSQRGPALITSAENTRGLTFILANTSQPARGPQHAQLMPWNGRVFFFFFLQKPSFYVFIHNLFLSNLHTFLLHQWPHPSQRINALLNCGRIKGLTPLQPNVHTALKEPATNSRTYWVFLFLWYASRLLQVITAASCCICFPLTFSSGFLTNIT